MGSARYHIIYLSVSINYILLYFVHNNLSSIIKILVDKRKKGEKTKEHVSEVNKNGQLGLPIRIEKNCH